MLINIVILVRLCIFILMEIFCVNNLIWFYSWSPYEKCIQIILIVLYLGVSIAFLSSYRIQNAISGKIVGMVAIGEGIVSSLILYLILTSVSFSSTSVWIVLLLQIYICAMGAYTYYVGKKID